MYPLGHLGTALIISAFFSLPAAAFVLGVFLPDMVDKGASVLGLIDCSRSVAHNVFFALGAGAVALAVTRSWKLALAVMLGCMLHLVQDSTGFVPYLYPAVQYDFGQCGEFKIQPGLYEYLTEAAGLALIAVWWKWRSKIIYLRESIISWVSDVSGRPGRGVRVEEGGHKGKARRVRKGVRRGRRQGLR